MLHNDGDKSASSHSITQNGNPQITDTAKFSQAGFFDGDGDYLSIPDSDDWDYSNGSFTIDTWVYLNNGALSNLIGGKNEIYILRQS